MMDDSKLKTFAQSLLTKYKTRMYRKEKDSFLGHCVKEFAELGYDDVVVKKDRNMYGMTSKNLVVGPPNADILITAHYDTPGRNGFMLLFNPLVGAVLGSVLFMVIIFFLPQYLQTNMENGGRWATYTNIIIIVIFIGSFFLKNKHNHNDNTSGVLGVYNMAKLVAQNPQLKACCAFVLFDHEEILPGLLGSKAFAKWRKKKYPDKMESTVINLDCIGVGNILTVMAKKKHDGWYDIAGFLKQEGFDVRKIHGGLMGNSDHASFPKGVSLLFQKRSLIGPLYIPNIHSGRDKVCDLSQIERLCGAVYRYVIEIQKG